MKQETNNLPASRPSDRPAQKKNEPASSRPYKRPELVRLGKIETVTGFSF